MVTYKPSETFIPFEKTGPFVQSLRNLVKLGQMWQVKSSAKHSKSSEAMTLIAKYQFNSPYMELKQDLQNRLVKALEEFNSEHFNSILPNTAVHSYFEEASVNSFQTNCRRPISMRTMFTCRNQTCQDTRAMGFLQGHLPSFKPLTPTSPN